MLRITHLLYIAVLLIGQSTRANIYPASTLYINSGEGFLFHLEIPSDFSIRECRLVYNRLDLYQLYPSLTDNLITDNYEAIELLSPTVCGARVRNVSSTSPASWELQADSTDETVAMVSGTLRLDVLSSVPESYITSESGIAGNFGTIQCPGDYNQQRHCRITDPKGGVIESCEVRVKYPAQLTSQPSIYMCQVFFWGRVDAVHTEVHVHSYQAPQKVYANMEDNADHVLLSCAVDEGLSVCRIESLTSSTQFLIMDGFQSHRYSTWNTHLDSGLCQFEIPKPIVANETGVWRIHGKLKSSGQWTGCVFHLNADMDLEYETFISGLLQNSVPLETTSETLDFQCADAPYRLDYCYLVLPTEEVIRPTLGEMDLFRAYGRCTFTGVPVTTGRYRCGFNSLDHSEDLFQHFDVRYNDPNVLADVQHGEIVLVDPSMGLTLMCYALQDYSINSCTFLAPSGDLYHLPNSTYSNSRFGYYGGGFGVGECGIELYRVDDVHMGNWTCSINLVDRNTRYDVYIMVRGSSNDGTTLSKWSVLLRIPND